MIRTATYSCVLLVMAYLSGPAQAQDSKAAIQQRLVAKYALTKTTAKLDDIVTAGCVLVLKKDKLTMPAVGDPDIYQNTYQNGSIKNKDVGKWGRSLKDRIPGASKVMGGDPRTFVSGEKLFVTAIAATDKGIVFSLFSDPFSDVRYKGSLLFPLPKDGSATADQVEKTVAEVFDIQPSDDAKKDQPQQDAAPKPAPAPVAPAAPAEKPPAPIAPPPPPPDAPAVEPPTVGVGQTTEQVVAIFGQPQRVMKTATKQIYVYKDMKVTFVKGKVTDVQ